MAFVTRAIEKPLRFNACANHPKQSKTRFADSESQNLAMKKFSRDFRFSSNGVWMGKIFRSNAPE